MANTYLQRSTTTRTNNQAYTFSCWFKRNGLTSGRLCINFLDSNNRGYIGIQADNSLFLYDKVGGVVVETRTSNFQLRDTNGWYHYVQSVNTLAGGSGGSVNDRFKSYLNGVDVSDLYTGSTNTGYNVNLGFQAVSGTNGFKVGSRETGADNFDGLMSHVHFVDGLQLPASTFGSTDSTTGEWKINTSPTVSEYGNNGFFILKDGNSVTDQSGKGNNFTVGGGTLTKTEDSPSNVFATLNPLLTGSYASLSNGNNTLTGTSSANNAHRPATLQVGTSGKYYYEVKITANENGVGFEYPVDGVAPNSEAIQQGDGNGAAGFYPKLFFACNGRIERSNLGTGLADLTGLTVIGSTGIKMFAIDMDNGAIYIGANGAWLNNGSAIGVPSSGSSKTGAMWGFNPSDYPNIAICSSAYDAAVSNYNFGNGYFGTTAVASAGTNASGNGIFEYDVPTGYTALSTKGLNL